ncbi:tetratricopeptide repeat protein [Shewanella morhuae]|uniref:tetratricopeptide repeat protein n=1 Tax=Shewanella morhuae TaxID=365591 RepID=UPI001C7D4C83|nr:flagellar protein MotX [Shewanella morhuae]
MYVFILLSLRVVMLRTALVALLPLISSVCFAQTEAVDIYSQDQLLDLIRSNQYLAKVKQDDCQLVQDIEARAQVLKQPLYQFLWGEMLNHGTCVKANPAKGIALLRDSAEQGSSEAMLKLADYYQSGKFVIRNKDRAVHYLLPAAASGDLTARMTLVRLFSEGDGSSRDYEMAYHWLYNDVFTDEATQKKALSLLKALAAKMPPSAVARAQQE